MSAPLYQTSQGSMTHSNRLGKVVTSLAFERRASLSKPSVDLAYDREHGAVSRAEMLGHLRDVVGESAGEGGRRGRV